MTRQINVIGGEPVTVDDCDFERLNKYTWYFQHTGRRGNGRGYASHVRRIDGIQHRFYLHRMVLNLTHGDGLLVDHIDRDRTNCTRNNLRVVNYSESNRNRDSWEWGVA